MSLSTSAHAEKSSVDRASISEGKSVTVSAIKSSSVKAVDEAIELGFEAMRDEAGAEIREPPPNPGAGSPDIDETLFRGV
jgi:hypothetical protein